MARSKGMSPFSARPKYTFCVKALYYPFMHFLIDYQGTFAPPGQEADHKVNGGLRLMYIMSPSVV